MTHIGNYLADQERFDDMPGRPQPVPIEATPADIDKARAVLRLLGTGTGMRVPFDFDWAEAERVWGFELRDFSSDVLERVVQEFADSVDKDFPTVGQVKAVATTIAT